MLRGMVFVDYMNLNYALRDLYGFHPKLRYTDLFPGIIKAKSYHPVQYVKTFIFAPEPDDFLKQIKWQQDYYDWLQGLNDSWYVETIQGHHISHRTDSTRPKDPGNPNSYYVEEKGTDVNLATNLLIKAFHNSYDIAFVFSADSDYIPTYRTLRNMGKMVVLVTVEGQGTYKTKPETDQQIVLTQDILKHYLREDLIKIM